ncbi:hypothetical protein WJX79_009041 [Trebouxia sp. C0005]
MLVQLGVEDAVYKIAHKLIQNELMIHNQVDATVPFIVKSHLGVFGSVEGAVVQFRQSQACTWPGFFMGMSSQAIC